MCVYIYSRIKIHISYDIPKILYVYLNANNLFMINYYLISRYLLKRVGMIGILRNYIRNQYFI